MVSVEGVDNVTNIPNAGVQNENTPIPISGWATNITAFYVVIY